MWGMISICFPLITGWQFSHCPRSLRLYIMVPIYIDICIYCLSLSRFWCLPHFLPFPGGVITISRTKVPAFTLVLVCTALFNSCRSVSGLFLHSLLLFFSAFSSSYLHFKNQMDASCWSLAYSHLHNPSTSMDLFSAGLTVYPRHFYIPT